MVICPPTQERVSTIPIETCAKGVPGERGSLWSFEQKKQHALIFVNFSFLLREPPSDRRSVRVVCKTQRSYKTPHI